jgi:hypothetical protein
MIVQGCFYSGSVVGTVISPSLITSLSPVKILIVSTFLSVLSPVIYPEILKYNEWVQISVTIILFTLSGIGIAVFTVTHSWIIIKIQQTNRRACSIGLQIGLLYLSGIIAGLLICFPDMISSTIDPWLLCVGSGTCAFGALLIIVTIKDEEVVISNNQGITLHNLSFFLSYFSIGVTFN